MATEIIKKSLYNGEVEIDFYPNSHQYKMNWEKLISVSTACGIVDKSWPLMYRATNLAKEYLLWLENITWEDIIKACGLHKEKKEDSASVWKQAHERAEMYIKNRDISLPEDERVCMAVQGFLKWVEQNKVEFIESEKLVYSKAYWYVWILDAVAKIDWLYYLIDFKTSNKIRKFEYWMQTSAYMKAYNEENWSEDCKNKYICGIYVVRFDKESPDFESWNISFEDSSKYFNSFLSALDLKKRQKILDKE